MEKLYAYALDRKKTCLHANFKSSTSTVIELHFFMKKEMKKMMKKISFGSRPSPFTRAF